MLLEGALVRQDRIERRVRPIIVDHGTCSRPSASVAVQNSSSCGARHPRIDYSTHQYVAESAPHAQRAENYNQGANF